ncbi:unnamed protein product [Rotaria sp. Silwood2]|nr:unnamed protein product [Rotaria sp. Silwood2]
MVERNSDQLFSCKFCSEETKQNVCIANCIGCKNLFCFVHLIQHRQELTNEFDQLIKQYTDMTEKLFNQLKINQHLEYIDKWEYEIIELIHQHTKDVKEKILCIFNVCQSELKRRHKNLGKELNEKRDLNALAESDLKELSQQMEQLDKDVQNINKVLNQISINELNQIVNKYNESAKPTGKRFHFYKNIFMNIVFFFYCHEEKLIKWNYLREIRLDSTYGHMAANNQQIFLGWKNRIVIYNIDGTQCDETRLESVEKYDYSILITLIIKNQLDENICCIRTNEQNLAVLIQNHKTHTWRLDLFNIYPFQCIQIGTSFDYFNQPNLGLFMPLHNKIYLFMNWETKLMRMIDSNGSNQIIDYNAFNACLLGTENKLIVNCMTHLKIYEF